MRIFDTLLLFADLPLLLWLLVMRRPWPPAWTAAFAVALGVAAFHLAIGGPRWQMIPAYAVTLGLAGAGLLRRPRSRWASLGAGALGLVLVIGAAGLAMVRPVFQLPPPTGPYPIGTVSLDLVDTSRPETHVQAGGGRRELVVQLWYPAATTSGLRPAPYRPSAMLSFTSSHLGLVKTHSFPGAPLIKSAAPLPVVLFNPNWDGDRFQNTAQLEALASNGFVAVGIDHPYNADLVVFFDGRVVRAEPDAAMDFSSEEGFQRTMRRLDQETRLQAEDARFVLDVLGQLNADDPSARFTGHLDLGEVGICGYSFGGAVAAEAAWLDPRFRAVFNMDGWLYADAAEAGVKQPYLKMNDQWPRSSPAELASTDPMWRHEVLVTEQDWQRSRQSFARYGGYELSVHGADSTDFYDGPLYSPLGHLTRAGSIDSGRMMAIINAYLVAFFRQHLVGTTEPLLHGPSLRFPEVDFVVWKPAHDPQAGDG